MAGATVIEKISTKNRNQFDEFLQFPVRLYGGKMLVKNTIPKLRAILTEPGEFNLYLAKKSCGEIVGRMVIGIQRELRDHDGRPLGYVGIFDCVQEYEVFKTMLDYAKTAMECTRHFLFPFFKATWYIYRCTSKGYGNFDYFMEFPDKPYYAEYARRYGVEEIHRYVGSITHDIDEIAEKNKKSYEKALAHGITFRDLDKKHLKRDLRIVYDLTVNNYQNNLYFTPISFEEFFSLYKGVLAILNPQFLTFGVNSEGREVCYGFAPPDYTPLFEKYDTGTLLGKAALYLNRNKVHGMILKTAATDAAHRQMGIYGGICYLHALRGKKLGYRYVIGGYTYVDNVTHKVMSGNLTWKEYELYRISSDIAT